MSDLDTLRALRGDRREISPDQLRPDNRPVMANAGAEQRILGLTGQYNAHLRAADEEAVARAQRPYRSPKDL